MDNGAGSYRRFLEGDKNALAEIIRDYRDGLVLYIAGFTDNICTAEEIAEEVFIKLYVSKPRFSGKSSFKTWLYSVGRFTAIDYIRKISKHRTASVDEFYSIADGEEIERNYIKSEQKIMLHRTMQKLKADYRQVLYLIYFEGFDTSQTAKIMHRTNRQVTYLLYRAKKSLKSELEREGFSYEEL
ncbi:MAG: RNA polymerase sigma factor [Ruminococcus flavefaciens]|nr:RNA polymerase sigma factor [Ruminococcus flavefaciens]MCM1234312.1 RNA polymerase sigma factor [Ruminococcus flavefaciens]